MSAPEQVAPFVRPSDTRIERLARSVATAPHGERRMLSKTFWGELGLKRTSAPLAEQIQAALLEHGVALAIVGDDSFGQERRHASLILTFTPREPVAVSPPETTAPIAPLHTSLADEPDVQTPSAAADAQAGELALTPSHQARPARPAAVFRPIRPSMAPATSGTYAATDSGALTTASADRPGLLRSRQYQLLLGGALIGLVGAALLLIAMLHTPASDHPSAGVASQPKPSATISLAVAPTTVPARPSPIRTPAVTITPTRAPVPTSTPTRVPTSSPTPRPTSTPTPVPPTATPAPSPTPVPSGVTFLSITGGPPGAMATASVQTAPGAACTIQFTRPLGTISTAQGLTPKTADASGKVDWTWKIWELSETGTGSVTVTCNGISASAPLEITG